MKSRFAIPFFGAVLFILIGLSVGALIAAQPQWKGKVETVDGVRIIRNPNVPLFGEIKLDLAEDLKIGRANDENYLFDRVRDVEVDRDGSIYVVDLRNFRVQKFDKNGKYLLTFGRKGQGPGEFDMPSRARFDESIGSVVVRDQAYTLEYFSADGKPLKSLRIAHGCYDFRIAPDGTVFAIVGTENDIKIVHSLNKVDTQGQIGKNIVEFPYGLYMQRTESGGILSMTTGHELQLLFNLLDNQSLVFGYSKEYVLTVVDFDGNVRYRIVKDEPYPKFTDKEKGEYKRMPLPEYKPYFYALFVDDLGRIYVQRNQADWHVEENVQKDIDVFSKDGYFLYRTKLPKDMYVVRNGYVYSCEVGDEEIIKRYRIKNWEAIRTSAENK